MADRNLQALEGGVIGANVAALAALAKRGPHDRCVEVLEAVQTRVKSLKVKTGKAGLLEDTGYSTFPTTHDVQRWLDGLTVEDKVGLEILKKFHNSLDRRVN